MVDNKSKTSLIWHVEEIYISLTKLNNKILMQRTHIILSSLFVIHFFLYMPFRKFCNNIIHLPYIYIYIYLTPPRGYMCLGASGCLFYFVFALFWIQKRIPDFQRSHFQYIFLVDTTNIMSRSSCINLLREGLKAEVKTFCERSNSYSISKKWGGGGGHVDKKDMVVGSIDTFLRVRSLFFISEFFMLVKN